MGAGKSRSVLKAIGEIYFGASDNIDSNVEGVESLSFLMDIVSSSTDASSDIANLRSMGVIVNESVTERIDDRTGTRKKTQGYPKTMSGYTSRELENHRNASIHVVNTICSALQEAGLSTNGLLLGYSKASGNAQGSFTYPGGFTLRPTIDIYAKTLSETFSSTTWSTANSICSAVGRNLIPSTIHELGHFVDYSLTGKSKVKFSKGISGKNAVSTYGNRAYEEAFAESFTLYCLGRQPTNGSDYHKNFVRAMENAGLSSLNGILSSPRSSGGSKSSSSTPKATTNSTTSAKTTSTKSTTPTKATTTKAPTTKATTKSTTTKTGGEKAPAPSAVSTSKTTTRATTRSSSTKTTSTSKTANTSSKGYSVGTHSVNLGGKTVSIEVTSAMLKRGYIKKTVNDKIYQIDVNTGAITVLG